MEHTNVLMEQMKEGILLSWKKHQNLTKENKSTYFSNEAFMCYQKEKNTYIVVDTSE